MDAALGGFVGGSVCLKLYKSKEGFGKYVCNWAVGMTGLIMNSPLFTCPRTFLGQGHVVCVFVGHGSEGNI